MTEDNKCQDDPAKIVDAKIQATLMVERTYKFIETCIMNTREHEELILLMPIQLVSTILTALKVADPVMSKVADISEPVSIMGVKVIATDSVDVATPTFARAIKTFCMPGKWIGND